MKNKILNQMEYYWKIFVIISFLSCNQPNIKQSLDTIDCVIDSQPDSALFLLENIKKNYVIPTEDLPRYELTHIKAKDKCYIDLGKDTSTIIKILNYYKDKTNTSDKGWAYYYAGRVFQDANKRQEACKYYIEAANYAKKTSNNHLGCMSNYYLAEFHAEQFMFEKAITTYKLSLNYCQQTKKKKFESILLSSVGYLFGQNNQLDSALYYLEKAYTVASNQKDTVQIANISNDLSVFLLEDKQYKKSKQYIKQSIDLHPDSIILSQYIILADIYLRMGKVDSAIIKLKQIEDNILTSKDIYNKAIYYETLSNLNESKKEYASSLTYYKIYTNYLDSIYKIKREISLSEIEHKYNYSKIEKQNIQLSYERKITIFLIIALAVLLILIYHNLQLKIRNKKNKLYEAEEKLNTMQLLLEKYSNYKTTSKDIDKLNEKEKEQLIKKLLLKQLDLSTKIALMHAQNPEKSQTFLSKFNELIYGEQRPFRLNWNELYPIFDILYKDFIKALRNKYPILVEKDIQLCCLLLIDLNTAEISFLMEQSINTVHKRKTEIRKKINMQAGTDIISFLREKEVIQP